MIPLAKLLLAIADAGLLGPKAEPLSKPVPDQFRCAACHSPRTRMKVVGFSPRGLAPIEGFELRCRVCGATNVFEPGEQLRDLGREFVQVGAA